MKKACAPPYWLNINPDVVFRDLALEVYRNATIEKVAYIRRLMQHAEREENMRTLWQSLLSVRPRCFCYDHLVIFSTSTGSTALCR